MEFDRYQLSRAPDCVYVDADLDVPAATPAPFMAGGKLFFPAQQAECGRVSGGRDAVQIMLSQPAGGLFVSMTPDGGRAFARCLIDAANAADAAVAEKARAAIGRAAASAPLVRRPAPRSAAPGLAPFWFAVAMVAVVFAIHLGRRVGQGFGLW